MMFPATSRYIRWVRLYGAIIFCVYLAWLFKILNESDFTWALFGSVTGVMLAGYILIYLLRPTKVEEIL